MFSGVQLEHQKSRSDASGSDWSRMMLLVSSLAHEEISFKPSQLYALIHHFKLPHPALESRSRDHSQPISGQNPGHVITLSQWEAPVVFAALLTPGNYLKMILNTFQHSHCIPSPSLGQSGDAKYLTPLKLNITRKKNVHQVVFIFY